MPADLPAYRVFIASPGDVPEERARALRVVERLGGEFADQLHLSAIAWERKTYGAHTDFQAQIEATRDCHLVVGILWQRVGTPLDGLRYARPGDGTPFESGTIFEIETALELRRSGTPPDVALFKKRAPPQQALSPEDARQLAAELPLLEAISRRWFRTNSGAFKAAFNDFTTPEGFEALLEQHIRGWLAERGHAAAGRAWRIETDGSPYPGLSPYERAQAHVFFGRDRARLAARSALTEAAARGCPFLLILGGSGAGKSSLARAGLLPSLALPGSAPGVDGWRIATLRPGAKPLSAMAEAVFDALPEMAEGEDPTPGAWAATLGHLPERAPRAVEKALARAGAASGETLRLLLLADQLEEAFDAALEQRQAFSAALAALARSGLWVVATLRADRYPALLEQPGLVALQAEGATQNLLPPDAEDIAAIIRDPARAAGLEFERDLTGRDLAQALRDDMDGADALPLLQMALARLFVERDRAANRLTFAAYAAMGGLRGAIQARADAVFAEADAAAQAELPAVLLALTAGLSEAGLALARPAPEAELATSPARSALLRVMVEGRLLVSERTATGAVQLRVAHEALLRNWPEAARILAPEHLRAKPRLEAALADWRERGAKARDLLRGTLLDAGLGLLRAHAAALPPTLVAFITRSRRADRWRRFGALGAAGSVAAVFGVLALLAWGFAQEAEREAAAAEAARARAETGFAAARDTAGSLIVELAVGLRNRAGMPAELVRNLLDHAGRALDSLLARTPDDPATLGLRGAVHIEFATTFAALGDTARQRDAAEQALRIFTRLAERDPVNTQWQRKLSVSNERMGDVLRAQGDLVGALREYRASMAIRSHLAESDPANNEWQRDLSFSHDRIGDVLRPQGNLPGGLWEYQASFAIRTRLAEHDPANTEWQRDLSISHDRIGDAFLAQGDLAGALQEYRASLEIGTRLAERDPANTQYQRDLSISHDRIGDVLRMEGDLAVALREYRASLAIRTRLAERDPANTVWQRELSVSHVQIGDVLRMEGDLGGAVREYRARIAISTRLAERDSANTEWMRELSISHDRIGDVLRAQGDLAGALQDYRTGMAIRTRLTERDTANTIWQQDLSISHVKIADVLRAQGDLVGALREHRASIAIRTRLTERDTANVPWQRDLFVSHWQLADIHLRLGQAAAARPHAEAAMAIARDSGARLPGQAETAIDLDHAEDLLRRLEDAAP